MKAPDKIYTEIDCETGFVGGFNEPTKADDIEYIRKDALLEWLKDELKKLENDRRPSYSAMALRKVIDKINSL